MNILPQIDRGAGAPLQDQLAEQLRQLIISGRLKPNSRIIATRFMAEQMGISRTTVLLAYERLISEGYLETRPAIGTFVSAAPPNNSQSRTFHNPLADAPRQASIRPALFHPPLASPAAQQDYVVDFRPAAQDERFSVLPKNLVREMRDALARNPGGFAPRQLIAGIPFLRQSLADYLALTRGMQITPDQVIVVAGQRQALSLIAHLFQRPGEKIVVESPGDSHGSRLFKPRGAHLVHVPVDESGLNTGFLPREPVALACVSPTRQNPTGAIMPLARRSALVQWARETGAYIIEDDCGIEPRYQGTIPPPIATLDPFGLTFHIGALAAVFGAGLNLTYLIAPAEFVAPLLALKTAMDSGGSWLEQAIAADVLSRGGYDQLLRRFRKICLERRDCLIQALRTHFGEVCLLGTEGGTQLTWLLPAELRSASAVREVALMHGVNIECALGEGGPGEKPSPLHDRALILGYAALTPAQLEQGVALLAGAVSL